MAAQPYAFPGSSGNIIDLPGTSISGRIVGYDSRETAGAAATFRLRDASSTGTILATVSLTAGQSTSDWWGPMGRCFNSGLLYFELVTGAVEGTAFIL